MGKPSKIELAAILAALSVSAAGSAQAATSQNSTSTLADSGPFGVVEHTAPGSLGTDDACGEGMCGTSDSGSDSDKKKPGTDKGQDGSCKGKDGSCKGKDGSCKGKDKPGKERKAF